MMTMSEGCGRFNRRVCLQGAGAGLLGLVVNGPRAAGAAESSNVIEFEKTLFAQREAFYRRRRVDMVRAGFRPVGGKVADFAVAEGLGRFHFFYIERRLQEGTPFYPGHEIYLGHASTADFTDWEVHDPAMIVRPDSWEEAHLWAPCIVRRGDRFVMAYTGVNRYISQDIGFASSEDLFTWQRWNSNPLSPCKGKSWAFWRVDGISSCRDPSICANGGVYWLIYTANTREGASCIAMVSSTDFRDWRDHGPICVGPADGYEARLEGGHPQGSLESASLLNRAGRWILLVKAKVRGDSTYSWIIESDRNDAFDFGRRRSFWPGAVGIEVIRDRGERSLLSTFCEGCIRLGVVDWSDSRPTGRFIASEDELKEWL